MAFTDKTLFEVTVSNSVRNQTQNIPGKFGTGTGAAFAAADCDAGTLCVRNGLIPSEGYEDLKDASGNAAPILNGNTWYMNAATNGNAGRIGDHTGIFAANTYNVQNIGGYNLGAKTLGLGIPAGERSDFTELVVGEQYTFGLGNFSTAPSTGVFTGYATIASGKLVYSSTKPADGTGVYLILLRGKNMNEGTTYAGKGYVCEVARAQVEIPEA